MHTVRAPAKVFPPCKIAAEIDAPSLRCRTAPPTPTSAERSRAIPISKQRVVNETLIPCTPHCLNRRAAFPFPGKRLSG